MARRENTKQCWHQLNYDGVLLQNGLTHIPEKKSSIIKEIIEAEIYSYFLKLNAIQQPNRSLTKGKSNDFLSDFGLYFL